MATDKNQQSGGNVEQLTNALLKEAGIDPSGKGDVIDKAARQMTGQQSNTTQQKTRQQDAVQTGTTAQQDTTQTDEITDLEQRRRQSIPQEEQEQIKAENQFVKKIDTARQRGFTDTEILDKIEQDRPELADRIESTREQTNDREALNTLSQEIAGEQPSQPSVPTEEQKAEQEEGITGSLADVARGTFEGAKRAVGRAGQKIKETFQKTAEGEITPAETGLQTVGAGAGAISDTIGSVVGSTIEEIGETETGQAIGETGKELLKTELGRKATRAIQEGGQRLEEFKQENPRLARNLGAALNIGELATDVTGVGLTSRGARGVAERGIREAGELTSRAVRKADEATQGLRKKTGEFAKEQAAGITEKTTRLTKNEIKDTIEQSGMGDFLEGVSPGEFIVEKGFTGDTRDIMRQLSDFASTNRRRVDEAIEQENKIIENQEITKAARDAVKTIEEGLEGARGTEETVEQLKRLRQKEELKLTDLQNIKRKIQDQGIFKAGGEIKSAKKAQGLANQERKIRKFIEDELDSVDIQKLNKDTQVAKTIEQGLAGTISREAKNRAISLTDFIFGSGAMQAGAAIGGPIGTGAGLAATVVGKNIIENPKLRTLFASKLNELGENQIDKVVNSVKKGTLTDEANEALKEARERTMKDVKEGLTGATILGISAEDIEENEE